MKVSTRHRVFLNCTLICTTETDAVVSVDLGDGTPTEIAVGTTLSYEDDEGSPMSVSFDDLPFEHREAIAEACFRHDDIAAAMVERQGKPESRSH